MRHALPISRFHSDRAFTLIELLAVIAIIGVLAAILIPLVGSIRESAHQTECTSNLRQIMATLHLYAADHDGNLPIATRATDPTIQPITKSPNSRWSRDLEEYLPQSRRANASNHVWDNEIFVCPSAETPTGKSGRGEIKMAYNGSEAMYGISGEGLATSRFIARNIQTIADPGNTPLVYDAPLLPTFNVQSNYFARWQQVVSDMEKAPEEMKYLSFRHKGHMNVLMADGAVKSVGPDYLETLTIERWRGFE